MIVVGASVLAPALATDSAAGRRARARLGGERLVAPYVLDLELVATLRHLALAGAVGEHQLAVAVKRAAALRIRRMLHVPLLPRIWALRHNLTPYDAAYVALAEAMDAPLLTADARLAGAPGIRCEVELLN
jgi:predicted nucleic acid-binding protein